MLAPVSRAVSLLLVTFLLVACRGGPDTTERVASPAPTPQAEADASPQPSPSFRGAAALIDTDDGSVIVRVEVAQTDEERMRGLMFRESMPEDHGMVFIWFEEHHGGFWMKNTLIPLSIAFFGNDGRILRIMDMDPCTEDPCPVYDPGVGYYGALEVNQGMFDEWGVKEGDHITMSF
jgi:uncharacterized protein